MGGGEVKREGHRSHPLRHSFLVFVQRHHHHHDPHPHHQHQHHYHRRPALQHQPVKSVEAAVAMATGSVVKCSGGVCRVTSATLGNGDTDTERRAGGRAGGGWWVVGEAGPHT